MKLLKPFIFAVCMLLVIAGCARSSPEQQADQPLVDVLKEAQEAAARGTPPEIAGEQIAKELFAPCNPGEKETFGDGIFESETFGKQMKTINGQSYEVCYYTQTDLRLKENPEFAREATTHFYWTEEIMLGKDGGIGYKTFMDATGTNRIVIERLSHTKGLCTAEVSDPAAPATLICINGETY